MLKLKYDFWFSYLLHLFSAFLSGGGIYVINWWILRALFDVSGIICFEEIVCS
jgi:hypothetical protein